MTFSAQRSVPQALAEQLQAAVETSQVGRDVQQDQENHHGRMVISNVKTYHYLSQALTELSATITISISIIVSIIAIIDLIQSHLIWSQSNPI